MCKLSLYRKNTAKAAFCETAFDEEYILLYLRMLQMLVLLLLLIIMKNINFNVFINMFGINLNKIIPGSFEAIQLQHFLLGITMLKKMFCLVKSVKFHF